MPRVIGIDPGTVSVDLFGLDDGRIVLDESHPTGDVLADPSTIAGILEAAAPLDLVAGPSGYGLPLVQARDLSDADVRLACLAPEGTPGGIAGLGQLLRTLAGSATPIVFTPGVIHLASVPAHRKVNRVDMGTADKVCAAVLAAHDQVRRLGCRAEETSFILLELGGAFTAAVAVDCGRIVDGIGGTGGPMGLRAAGALDGEVAFLAGSIEKQHLFGGGAATVSGAPEAPVAALVQPDSARGRLAWEAFLESAQKAVAALAASAPGVREIILSGRLARVPAVCDALSQRLRCAPGGAAVRIVEGLATVSSHAAQGAALLADGLAGGSSSALVSALGVRDASGSVLDHLHVISPRTARKRIGLG